MRRFAPALAALFVCAIVFHAAAQTKITYGYTAIVDTVGVFAAREQGYFAAAGLDVSFQRVAQTAVVGPALMANSFQIGVLTAPTFLEAVAGGIDLVAITGLSLYSTDLPDGAVARTGATIHKASDFVGKRVAVASLRGISEILFVKWLDESGVDPEQVTFVEAPFPRMADLLKGGIVDAVLVGRPFLNHILDDHIGYMVAPVNSLIAGGRLLVLTATTRDWAKRNGAAVTAFRKAVDDGTRYAEQNPEQARAYIAKYLQLSPEVAKESEINKLATGLEPAQFNWWIDLLNEQHLISHGVETATLIAR